MLYKVLHQTLNEFSFEEQTVIYLYRVVKLPIGEIAELTELSCRRVAGLLILYSERLAFNLDTLNLPIGTEEIIESEKNVIQQSVYLSLGLAQ